nr:hypothetical protein [Armatimonadota bacterium]
MADLLQPATTLDEVLITLSPEPLDSGAKLKAFYTDDVNAIRGGDKIAPIAYLLGQHYNNAFYRAFLMGHQGVGKSTELARLVHQVRFQFRPVRFSATKDLNPTGFTPFDVLLVMLVRLIQEIKDCGGRQPSESLLRDVKQWFSARSHTETQQTDSSAEVQAEAGVKTPSLLEQILTLGVRFNASRKYALTRQDKTEEVETASIPELIGLVNKLLGECSSILKDVEQK